MTPDAKKFLKAVLGVDGASALHKAIQRDSSLDSIVVPRAIIGWLSFITQYSFEDNLPGVENSYIEFQKNEDGTFTGSIAIGDDVHEFESQDIYHMASAISVALSEDIKPIDQEVKTVVLERLGKSIDALAKAHEVIRATTKNIGTDITKAISLIPKGQEVAGSHDYSHVLKPEHRASGYSLKVKQTNVMGVGSGFDVSLQHKGKEVGNLTGFHEPEAGSLEPSVAHLEPEHQGRGLGQAMYEAMFAHGYHNGVRTIEGGGHSTSANRVHSKLQAKHGMSGYNPQPRLPGKETGPFDAKFGAYKYTLKQELPMNKVDLPGKTAGPVKPLAPQGPVPPAKQPKLTARQLKTPSLKIGKSEAQKPCGFCDGHQFTNNKFTGCACFRSEAPLIKTTVYSDGYVLDFKKDCSVELYLTLSRYFRG